MVVLMRCCKVSQPKRVGRKQISISWMINSIVITRRFIRILFANQTLPFGQLRFPHHPSFCLLPSPRHDTKQLESRSHRP